MPREMLKRAWHEWRGGMEPIYLTDLSGKGVDDASDEALLEDEVRPLAATF
jgi:hypothetical protein